MGERCRHWKKGKLLDFTLDQDCIGAKFPPIHPSAINLCTDIIGYLFCDLTCFLKPFTAQISILKNISEMQYLENRKKKTQEDFSNKAVPEQFICSKFKRLSPTIFTIKELRNSLEQLLRMTFIIASNLCVCVYASYYLCLIY